MCTNKSPPQIRVKDRLHSIKTIKDNQIQLETAMNTVIIKKEIVVPAPVIAEVCEFILDHQLPLDIIGADEEDDTLTLEVQYEKRIAASSTRSTTSSAITKTSRMMTMNRSNFCLQRQ
jgi:hypothetical protein